MGNPFSATYEDISKIEDSLAFDEDFRDILEQLEDIEDLNSEEGKEQYEALKQTTKDLTESEVGEDAECGETYSENFVETRFPWEISQSEEL